MPVEYEQNEVHIIGALSDNTVLAEGMLMVVTFDFRIGDEDFGGHIVCCREGKIRSCGQVRLGATEERIRRLEERIQALENGGPRGASSTTL